MLAILRLFFSMMWFWLFVSILADIIRDNETSGAAKAGWILLLLVVPFLGALVFLIERGKSMASVPFVNKSKRSRHSMTTCARPPVALVLPISS